MYYFVIRNGVLPYFFSRTAKTYANQTHNNHLQKEMLAIDTKGAKRAVLRVQVGYQ